MKSSKLFIFSILLPLLGCSQNIVDRSRTFEIESHNIKLKKETKFNPLKKSRILLSNNSLKLDSVSIEKAYNFIFGTDAEPFFSVKIEYPLIQQFSQDSIKIVDEIKYLGLDESIVFSELKLKVKSKTIRGIGAVNTDENARVDSYFVIFDSPQVIYFTFYKITDNEFPTDDFRQNTIYNYLKHAL